MSAFVVCRETFAQEMPKADAKYKRVVYQYSIRHTGVFLIPKDAREMDLSLHHDCDDGPELVLELPRNRKVWMPRMHHEEGDELAENEECWCETDDDGNSDSDVEAERFEGVADEITKVQAEITKKEAELSSKGPPSTSTPLVGTAVGKNKKKRVGTE